MSPGQIVVTNGGKQAIYEAFATMLDPGDEVIVPAPYWTTYPESIQLAGGVAVPVLADETQDYKVTVDQLEAARTEHTKVLLFVSPSNPTGAVYTADEIRAIGAWVEEHQPLGADRRDLRAPRLRRGRDRLAACALPRPRGPLRRRQRRREDLRDDRLAGGLADRAPATSPPPPPTCSRTPPPTSATSRSARPSPPSTGDLSAVAEMKTAFDRRRRTIVSMLDEIDGVVCPMPQGAFYAYPSVKGLLGRTHATADGSRTIDTSADLAEYILEQAEVAVVPGEAFGSPGYLRLSYALGDDDLVEGITRLQKLFA